MSDESNQNITNSDQPSKEDTLGLTPYVIAMTEFLTHPDTKPPLTISIEGEWGSGKSSFMKQLEEQIKVKSKELRKEELKKIWSKIKEEHITSDLSDICKFLQLRFSQETQTVWFNAWKHDKAESLWATFAISFLEEISRNRDFSDCIPNLYSSLLLFIKRLDFKEKPMKSLQTLFGGIVICSIIVGFIYVAFFKVGFSGVSNWSEQVVEIIEKSKGADKKEPKKEEPPSSENSENLPLSLSLLFGGAGSSLAVVGKLLAKLKELIGDPKMDLTQYLESPDYKKQVTFVETFHADFRKIVEAYVGKDEKVYVFIDDLDRCELGKAADLLQALNMMISNDPQIIFILGMDREKVAAGITYKQKDVLPYLASIGGKNQDTKDNYTLSKQLDYGFSYLEKFVQLSFTLPKPSENSLNDFFVGLSPGSNENQDLPIKTFFRIPYNFIPKTIDYLQFQINKIQKKFQKASLKKDIAPAVIEEAKPNHSTLAIFPIITKNLEKDEKEDLVKMVAPFFDNNPRRLKQYINALRLKRYMYYYAIGVKWEEKEQITQQQLGKFIAITLKYPRLLNELEKDNKLLENLETCAINKSNSTKSSQDTKLIIINKPIVNSQGDVNYGDANYWINTYPKLAALLSYEVEKASERYSLKTKGIKRLLEVSPKLDLDSKYFKLREFLEAKKWREADEETANVMRQVANREDYGWLDIEDIDNFSCKDLGIIDQLWVKYSEGRFGFSVQKTIYQELGGTREYNWEIWAKFGDRVGWRKDEEWLMYDELTFSTDAYKIGHLPSAKSSNLQISPIHKYHVKSSSVFERLCLFSRVETCKL